MLTWIISYQTYERGAIINPTYSWGNRKTEKLYTLAKIAQPVGEDPGFESRQPGSKPKVFPAGLMGLPRSLHSQNERECFYVGALMYKSFPPFSPWPAFLNRCLLILILYTRILLNYCLLRQLACFTKRKN